MTRRNRTPSRSSLIAILTLAPLVGVPLAMAASPVEKLQEFPLDQIQITDKYQVNLFAKEVTYLNTTLDADRLLNGFKAMSSGTNPTNLYGGWENSLIRGHTMGHWLSAMARAYQQTKGVDDALNAKLKTKLDHVISMLKTYQKPDGFLFATPVDQFGAPEGKNVSSWVPWYTMHKILAGLVDVAKFEDSTEALGVASKLGDWIYSRASGWDSGTRSRVLGMEYGGMNDALYELYKLTNSSNHLAAAHIFDETNLFTTTAAGNDTLSGKHANTTIPKFIGALNRYRTLGTAEQSYFTAADQFLSIVLKNHTYITGGNSQDEHFHTPGKLDQYRDNVNNETCNAYNMSKLGRDLFLVTGDVKYADYYERVHINEILASMNPTTGMTTYFKAMGTGYFKVFGSPTNHFWCCTGSGMENFTRLNDSVYFHDSKDLWVAYYVSSTLNWKERGLTLTQTTDLPLTNKVKITVDSAPADEVAMKFRKPYWTAGCAMGITVNGETVTPVETNGFFSVSRVWKAKDEVELSFPLVVQYSRLQDNQNAVAFTYGPIVLSAGLGTASMTTSPHGVQVLKANKPSGLQENIAINGGTSINAWLANLQENLVQTPGKLEFKLKNTDSDNKLVFIPHFSRYEDRYGIYWKLTGGSGGDATPKVVCPTVVSTGGTTRTGGATSTGGATGGSGGAVATGGSSTGGASSGGSVSSGGALGSGGDAATGGATRSGGSTASGGSASSGGKTSTGGSTSTGGRVAGSGGSQASGGSMATGGARTGTGGVATQPGTTSSGCSCEVGSAPRSNAGIGLFLFGLAAIGVARRRRR